MEKLKNILAVVYWLIIVTVGMFAYAWAFASDIAKKFGERSGGEYDRERLRGFREGFAEGVRYQKWRKRREEI